MENTDGRISRRTLLRSAGGLASAFGSGCVGTLVRKTRVPVFAGGGTAVESEKVPRVWQRHVTTVRRARRTLESALPEEGVVEGVKVVRSEKRYAGLRGFDLAVEVSQSASELPEEVEDVAVRVETALDRGLSACFNTESFDPVPGGVAVKPTVEGRFGTNCCRVFVDGRRRLLTAAHLWRGCEMAPQGEDLYQGDRLLGAVDSLHPGYDVALVAPRRNGPEMDGTIKLETDRRVPVAGRLTEWGIAVFLAEAREIANVGVSSGLTRGRLSAAYVRESWNDCVDFDGHGVEAEYRNVEGDSGGPAFAFHDGTAYLVATQQMWVDRIGTDCGDNIVGDRGRGTASYHLDDELGIRFAA